MLPDLCCVRLLGVGDGLPVARCLPGMCAWMLNVWMLYVFAFFVCVLPGFFGVRNWLRSSSYSALARPSHSIGALRTVSLV